MPVSINLFATSTILLAWPVYKFLSRYWRPATSREAATVPTPPAMAAALGPRVDLKRAPARKPARMHAISATWLLLQIS